MNVSLNISIFLLSKSPHYVNKNVAFRQSVKRLIGVFIFGTIFFLCRNCCKDFLSTVTHSKHDKGRDRESGPTTVVSDYCSVTVRLTYC